MEKHPTIKDVSRLAGVSVATASRAMNGSGYVSERSRKSVMEAVKQLSYQSNALASGLKRGKTGVIGLVVPKMHNLFFMQVLESLEDELSEYGYSILVAATENDEHKERHAIEKLLAHKVDGLVVATAGSDGGYFQKINGEHCPVVLIDRKIEGVKVDMVIEENEKTAYELTQTLIRAGHRRILILSGLTHLVMMAERLHGSQWALAELGIPREQQSVLDGANNIQVTRKRFKEYIQSLSADMYPTAVVSLNPRMTEGIMLGIRDLCMRVPEDISLSSFGELTSELITPRLCCVVQNGNRIGQSAAQILLRRMDDDKKARQYETIVFENTIQQGDSIRPA